MAIITLTNELISDYVVTPLSERPIRDISFFQSNLTDREVGLVGGLSATGFTTSTSLSKYVSVYSGSFIGENFTTETGSTGINYGSIRGTVNSFTIRQTISWNDPLTPSPFPIPIQKVIITVEGLAIPFQQLDPADEADILLRVNFGNDQISGSVLKDIIEAGTGDDTVNGNAGDDIINGENGNDRLDGDAGNDHIVGGGGQDTIDGGDGNDLLIGQDGNDFIYGRAGDDTLSGENGNDILYGGDGNDYIYGGNGDDKLFGEGGNDVMFGGVGRSSLFGGDGNDTLYGNLNNFSLYGENGDDLLFGSAGRDYLVGGAGNDWLVGGAGDDNMDGGDGDDGFLFESEDINFRIQGGAGFDTVFFDSAAPGNIFTAPLWSRNIEQAIGTRLETGNEAWASITTVYDAYWQTTKTEFLNDDGSKSIWRYDPNNQQSWNEIRDYYTAGGKLDYEQVYYDDGSSMLLDFDLNNETVWHSRSLIVNAAGVVTSDTFILDATLAHRSAEIGVVFKKILIDDALI